MEDQFSHQPKQEPADEETKNEIGCVYRVIGLFLAAILFASPFTFILEVTPRELRGRMFGPLATWRVQREINTLITEDPTITRLDLSERNTNRLPAEVGILANLETLLIRDNNLTMLPVEIGNLQQLQELNLSSNQLTHLPAEIGNLTQLTSLNLNNNLLVQLPPEIGQLTSLRELNLNNNCDLQTLPVELVRLPNLARLSLQRTRLTEFDIPRPLLENPALIIEMGATIFPCPPHEEPNPIASLTRPIINLPK